LLQLAQVKLYKLLQTMSFSISTSNTNRSVQQQHKTDAHLHCKIYNCHDISPLKRVVWSQTSLRISFSINRVITHINHRDLDLEYRRAGDLDLDREGDLERLGDLDLVLDLEGLLLRELLLERDLDLLLLAAPSCFTRMWLDSFSCDLNLLSSRYFAAHSISFLLANSTIPVPSLYTSAHNTSPASRMWSFKSCQLPVGGRPDTRQR